MPKAKMVAAALVAAALTVGISPPLHAQTKPPLAQTIAQASKKPVPIHRVVIQITENDPGVMNVALNNAENLVKFYEDKGEKIEVEFVAYGPGLSMMRSDVSPVKDRVASMSSAMKNVTFTGCNNTLEKQSKQENKTLTLLPQAHLVPAGIARIVELEEQGWSYVRP